MATAARSGEHRPISRREWRTIALLGLPTLGLSLSVTTVTAYLPKVASEFIGSSAVIVE